MESAGHGCERGAHRRLRQRAPAPLLLQQLLVAQRAAAVERRAHRVQPLAQDERLRARSGSAPVPILRASTPSPIAQGKHMHARAISAPVRAAERAS